jgi:dipeptide/tripeptide permease
MAGAKDAGGEATWRFPAAFWTGNTIELFERAAYYGTFIALALYLTDIVGFTDVQAGWIGAVFSSCLYLLPFVTGAAADRLGFRSALILAFALLACGYAGLGFFPHKLPVLLSLPLIVVGGAFVKPIISGTVAKCSDEHNRARAFSIFYMVVNIGAFGGKAVAKPVRTLLGLDYVPLYSAGAAVIALVLVVLFYWPKKDDSRPRSAAESLRGLATVMRNYRFLALILITAGFWVIQGQLYASMPKYVIRIIGPEASPEWLSNVNSAVVILLVIPITQLVRKMSATLSIGLAMALVPFSAVLMALAGGMPSPLHVLGMAVHPLTLMMIVGIAVMSVAECFLSPKYLEYASKQAPPGQEGLYMGYSHLNTFFAWFFGFIASGYLLDAFCPDPKKLAAKGMTPEQIQAAFAHAPYLWYTFAAVGALAFLGLILFKVVTDRVDRRKAAHT